LERPKVLLLWLLVFAAAGVIVWRVGFHTPQAYTLSVQQRVGAGPSPGAPDANQPTPKNQADAGDPNANAADPNAPADPNQPSETEAPKRPSQAVGTERPGKPGEPNRPPQARGDRQAKPAEPNDPNATGEAGEPMEAVNLKDVEVKNLVEKIAKWTGKTVIPHEEAMKQKITIYAPEKLPRADALRQIYSALRMKGYVAEEAEDTIFLRPISDAKLGSYPTLSADQPLAMLENKDQVVQKFFKLTTYNPSQMAEIVQPLVGEYGHVSADETTGMLLVIDTVANLMRIERIMKEFDVPEAEQAVTEIFEIQYGDPSEIVQMLNILLGEADPRSRRYYGRDRYRSSRPVSQRPPSGGRPDSKSAAASSVVISSGEVSVVLIPEPRRNWIIGKGPAEVMKQVREWIAKLDKEEPVESEYEIVKLMYADPREVEGSVEDGFADLPGTEFLPSVMLEALPETRQVMIFGRKDLRDMVKKMILELDVPPGEYEEKVFDLKHADPEQIKENIENLYSEQTQTSNRYNYYYSYRYGRGREQNPSEIVRVIAFPTMGQVTVIASPENMRKIEKQIAEWDSPLDVDAVKPRIIELKNSDPVQMAELLTKLFSEEEDMSRAFFRSYLYGYSDSERKKIVGPLYGQLTFEEVPGTKKIIVISKIPQAYDVVEQLIFELDRQEMAEVPHVVQLQYADPEDLAERLNAVFNEPGTTAPIRRSERGLSEYSMESEQGNQNQNSSRNEGGQGAPGEYTPWWSRATRGRVDEEPISNVIGRVRFIPDPRSKSILVLAPPEFQDSIEKTIKALDTPGKQVLIKAIVVEVDHSSMTSLGVQLATNPDAFGSLGENAVTALGELTNLATRGSAVASERTGLGAEGTGTIVGGTTAVYALIDFLIKTTHAKIMNQQTLWTEDNEEAMFFKGEQVAFLAGATTSASVGVTQDVDFRDVGMTLQVRPSITPEKRVDMEVRVDLSQLTSQLVNSQPVTSKVETETNMIVRDGETIMLGGMLFQKESLVKRKLPLLGDLPLVGGLFQHNDAEQANSELIVFVTPFVIDDGEVLTAAAQEQLEGPRKRLDNVQQQLDANRQMIEHRLQNEK